MKESKYVRRTKCPKISHNIAVLYSRNIRLKSDILKNVMIAECFSRVRVLCIYTNNEYRAFPKFLPKIYIIWLEKRMLQLLRSLSKSFRFKVGVDFFETKDNPHRVGYYMLYDFNQHYQNRKRQSHLCVTSRLKGKPCKIYKIQLCWAF